MRQNMQKHLSQTSFSLPPSSSPVPFSFHLFGNSSYDVFFLFNILVVSSDVLNIYLFEVLGGASLSTLRFRGLWKILFFNIL